MQIARFFRSIFIKLDFSPHVAEKYSNTKFHENLSNGGRVAPCGQK
jgi:hypothetical protein